MSVYNKSITDMLEVGGGIDQDGEFFVWVQEEGGATCLTKSKVIILRDHLNKVLGELHE